MLTHKVKIGPAIAGITLAAFTATSVLAFDPDKVFKPGAEPQAIMKYGFEAYKNGRKDDALGAFKFAATKKHLPSQWKLARMYQLGDGVAKDDWVAFQMFQSIADRFAEIPPNRRDMPYVSSAVVALGVYHQQGIPNTPVKADLFMAENRFYRAAALYSDPNAQYRLANLYLDQRFGKPQPVRAARWLTLASKKGHADAQAKLGSMLFEGRGVRRNPVRGLVMLTAAAANSAQDSLARISRMQKKAFMRASRRNREAAEKIIARMKLPVWKERTPTLFDQNAPVEGAWKASRSD